MKIISSIKRMLRGEVSAGTAMTESVRRIAGGLSRQRERGQLDELAQQPARLREEFARIRASDLLAHFRSRTTPKFFPGFQDFYETARLQQEKYPEETDRLLCQAVRITEGHCWDLLGFGEKCFGGDEIRWNRDPLSGHDWPLDYHADVNLFRHDGSDARVVWELNRLAQLITLGRAFVIANLSDKTSGDHADGGDRFAAEFFLQLRSWRRENPLGIGVNWNCAMEVALRAMNLLTAFSLFVHAPLMNEMALKEMLQLLDQHGAHIQRNLEFSHIATSNHYLSDVTGLLWLGLMLPELRAAQEWREFGLRELLNEIDKQILPDGADYEASTGYHRLKLELLLYSFVLCHLNGIDIEEKYWKQIYAMVNYVRAYLRPDGRAPLIGDSDSGQILPIVKRSGDDHAYILSLAAAIFQEPKFKVSDSAAPPELLWLLGAQGIRDYQAIAVGEARTSQGFANAGVYVLRHRDLYLLFNAGDCGAKGRGSHGHNDALSIEVSACGTSFIVDPGSYVYTANLHERHLFRSTAYHSTVEVDSVEQNSIEESDPFIISNEAQPKVLEWSVNRDQDFVKAEHYGYQKLSEPVTHSRTITFNKPERYWIVSDRLSGEGDHRLAFRFHFAAGLEVKLRANGMVEICDKINDARLIIAGRAASAANDASPELEERFSSRDYGAKDPSLSCVWKVKTGLPFSINFAIVPICSGENETERLATITNLL